MVVVGGGVVGSATALELCRRGRRVTLIERFHRGHLLGSSHGPTRIFRLSYPDPKYAALAVEALDDWARLERDGAERLMDPVGGLDLGEGALACASALEGLGVESHELDAKQVSDLAGISLDPGTPAIFQPQTGVIAASRTVRVQLGLAAKAGCQVQEGTQATSIRPSGQQGVVVETGRGEVSAGVAVLCAGPWIRPLAATAGFDLPLVVTSEQVTYLRPLRDQIPVVIDWREPLHYLVPMAFGAPGWKVGLHQIGAAVDPDAGPFLATEERNGPAVAWVRGLTGSLPEVVADETCLYTNAPSDEFILERQGDIVVVSACSGHGFKFAPRIGRAAADLAQGVDPRLPKGIGQF